MQDSQIVCPLAIIKNSLSGVSKQIESEYLPEKHHDKDSVAIEIIKNHIAQAIIVPVTMYKQQLLEELKLSNCKIRGHDSLPPLLAADAHSNIRHLYHRYIVCTCRGNIEISENQTSTAEFFNLDQISVGEKFGNCIYRLVLDICKINQALLNSVK